MNGYTEQKDESTELRWISTAFYQDAVEGFSLYDPEEWLPTLSFSLSAFMFWPWFFVSATCLGLTIWVEMYPEYMYVVDAPLDAHIILGGALSFLVVMRTDASMNRWQDARGAWQTVFNCVTSLGAQTAPLLRDDVSTELFLMQLMAFTVSLKGFLRDEKIKKEECGGRMDWQYMRLLNASTCPPMQALKNLAITCREHVPEDSKLASAIFDEVSEQIRVINHAVGTMRLIKTTPQTKGYVTTLRSFLILWLATLPLGIIGKFEWLATPVLAFISFLFLNIEKMAVEIEQPFGDDANDLPQEQYIMQLEEVLLEMVPGYEPEVPPDDEDGAGPILPVPGTLPPGRYYMDVPALGSGGPPGQWAPQWNQVSPAWRQQFRSRTDSSLVAGSGAPMPPQMPPPPGGARRTSMPPTPPKR